VRMTIDPGATSHPFGGWDESSKRWVVRSGSYTVSVGTAAAGTFLTDSVRVLR
jgi:beta-glucosidase